MSEHQKWLNKITKYYKKQDTVNAFQVLFPQYRPDLSLMLAHHLNLKFFDYRASIMQSEGWNADQITLDSMTNSLLHESKKTGLVVHNIEALLCTKSKAERKQWLADFFSIDWPNPIIIPIAIYQSDTLKNHPCICDIEHIQFPEQSFVMQLAM